MQFLNKDGLSYLWSKIKAAVQNAQTTVGNYTINGKAISSNPVLTKDDLGLTNIDTDATYIESTEKGANSGVATLGADGKVPEGQLSLKTINNQSIYGSGNISIDLGLYQVVSALPTESINENKIYLVATAGGGGTQDTYTEYIRVEGAWEKLGEYRALVDLTPYVKFTDIASASKAGVVQLGYADNGKNYAVQVSEGKAFVNVPWTDTNTTYAQANSTTLGLVKIGASQDGNKYPVELNENGQMYVDIALSGATGDHKVTQEAVANTDGSFNLLTAYTAGSTTAETNSVKKARELTYNPSTKVFTVGGAVNCASLAATGAVTGNTVTASGVVTGNTIVKQGGTSEQILMADGSVATALSNSDIDEICV